ncbi:MAG: alanine--tRNA ligase [Firmicutes bacterium]|nr:alanine--tRNA ligase [Bacillota bacterium]
MSGNEIRSRFLQFMEKKGHLVLPSASLVPEHDPSLLLIGAGMAPFKRYFTGQVTPPRHRIATSQKCVRTGDLENVGRTARHHTFFEMLGNFSFGDYFKSEAIPWAWEFLTEDLELPKDRLWISVYTDDDEAYDIWHNVVGVSADRIVRLGKDTNFWEIGPGPCGPCSEIYIDLGPERGCGSPTCGVGCDCDRYLEIWNLVFTQFDRDEEGNYTPLPKKNIDTGMGLERITSVLQQVPSNFETDLLFPIIEAAQTVAGIRYGMSKESDVALKVIADHSRAFVHLIADGVLPSNEGRGYVLRRLLRRAVRYGRLLGMKQPFLGQIVSSVVKTAQPAYPELVEQEAFIQEVVGREEERFLSTLDTGLDILSGMVTELKKKGQHVLSGPDAFRLYDTYGFPLDLTKEILSEQGLQVDEDGFEAQMQKQRKRARQAREQADGMGVRDQEEIVFSDLVSQFTGYDNLVENKACILALVVEGVSTDMAAAGEVVQLVLNRTPFYSESGGQVGDQGLIYTDQGQVQVRDVKRMSSGAIVHIGQVITGSVHVGDTVTAQVDKELRLATARHHTATHLLHQALRQVLGEHVHQAGSLVAPDRLRFDFSHFGPVTQQELQQVERLVNQRILENISLEINVMTRSQAEALGAMALFEEKYGDLVRVVKIGSYSLELCGGTHVKRTGDIGLCHIVEETSVGAGVRRIEAVAGMVAWSLWQEQDMIVAKAAQLLGGTKEDILTRLESLIAESKEKDKEIARLNQVKLESIALKLVGQAEQIGDSQLLAACVAAQSMDDLRQIVDTLKIQLPRAVIILGYRSEDKANFLAYVSPSLVSYGLHAGQIVKAAAQVADGGGGGRPEMAQAGGRKPSKLEQALSTAAAIAREKLQSI